MKCISGCGRLKAWLQTDVYETTVGKKWGACVLDGASDISIKLCRTLSWIKIINYIQDAGCYRVKNRIVRIIPMRLMGIGKVGHDKGMVWEKDVGRLDKWRCQQTNAIIIHRRYPDYIFFERINWKLKQLYWLGQWCFGGGFSSQHQW